MRRQRLFTLNALLATLLVAVLPAGCNFEIGGGKPDPPPEFQTRILEIKIDPNPVAPGDSVQFTCVIEDSLDPSFEFRWFIDGMNTIVTDTNILKIKTPEKQGTYNGGVEADNGDTEKLSPNKGFWFEVKQN